MAKKITGKLGYNSESGRYMLGEYDLHAGNFATIIDVDGQEKDARIEYDRDRGVWYFVGHEDKYPEDFDVVLS